MHFPHKDGPKAGCWITSFNGAETLSDDFVFTLELISDDANIPLKDAIGKMRPSSLSGLLRRAISMAMSSISGFSIPMAGMPTE